MTDYFTQTKYSTSELIWKLVVFICITLVAVEAPLSFALDFFHIKKWQLIADSLISLVFIVDAIYNYREDNKKRKPIFTIDPTYNESKNNLLIDSISAIPFDLIIWIFQIPGQSFLFHLMRLLRLVRIMKIYSLLPAFPGLHLYARISLVFVWCLMAIHWIACGWMVINPMNGTDLITFYNISLYWSVTTLTTIGYGDVTPHSNIGRLYTMVIMILGVGVYGIVIGSVSKMIYMADRYKERTKEKINDITLFMKHYSIPFKLQRDVFSFYNHLFTKRLSDNDSQIISELPNALQQELQVYMNLKLIQNVSIFQTCKQECLKDIAAVLEQIYCSPGQKVISKGDIGQEMYIIGHGQMEIKMESSQVGTTLSEGQCFGEVALIQETTRTADVRAVTYCDLYKLKKEDFLQIIEKHPVLLKNMEKSMKRRSSDS
jgi:hypothetical protein